MKLRIPADWNDVSPSWMTRAIASRHPDAEVATVELVTRDDGTNRRARFRLSYSRGTGPEYVFCKAHTPRHRLVHLRNGNLFNEARLFASDVPLPVDHPLVYTAITDRLRLDFLLVMEDLTRRDADPRDATRPMTVTQVSDGVRGLARLHSRFWGLTNRNQPALKWLKTWRPSRGWQVGLRRCVPLALERHREALPEQVTRHSGDEIVDFWARFVSGLRHGPATLLHGDAHIGNTYVLPGDRVGFLDWQVARRGNWSQDMGYFMVGALSESDRRGHEESLLQVYHDALELPSAQRPSLDEITLRYRASHAYGLAIWLSTLGSVGYQSTDISLALARRFAAAFVDHDTLSALESLDSR